MSRLLYVSISNLACFEALVIRPGASSLLLGINGSGKSTLFDIIFGLRGFFNRGVEADVAFPTYQVGLERPHHTALAAIDLQVSAGRSIFRYQLGLDWRDATLVSSVWALVYESLTKDGSVLTSLTEDGFQGAGVAGTIPLSRDRSPLAAVKFPDSSAVQTFKAWAEGIWLLRLEPRRMIASARAPEENLAVSGENFVAWLLGFTKRKTFLERIVGSIGSSIEGLTGLALVRAGREWVLVGHFATGAKVDFDQLSDGQRCLIVLHAVLVLARRHCTLLLLDEPDAHVTPTEILPLLSALREQVEAAGIQVIISSHHPQVIDAMASESPWEMVWHNGRIVAEPYRVEGSTGVSPSRHLLLRGRR